MDTLLDRLQDYWHVYSDGKRADIPFLSEEDKVLCWNSICLCSWRFRVTILVATVNDTHLHLIAHGTEKRMERFVRGLRFRLKSYFSRNGKEDQAGEGILFACDPITMRKELMQKFMYVYRNCLDFFPFLPGDYAWGSGYIYFSRVDRGRGTPLSDLPARTQRMMLRTGIKLPQDWRCDPNGRIVPDCFIDYQTVERLFGSVKAFIAFLFVRKEDEAAIKQEIGRRYLEYRTLEDLRAQGNRYARQFCGKRLPDAPFKTRLRIASLLIKNRHAGKSESLAKALYLKKEDLDRLL